MFDLTSINKTNINEAYQLKTLIESYRILPMFHESKPELLAFLKPDNMKEKSSEIIFNEFKGYYDNKKLSLFKKIQEKYNDVNQEIIVKALKILVCEQSFSKLNLDEEEQIVEFIKEFQQLKLWQIEILEHINKEKFNKFKKNCIIIYKKYCSKNNISYTFSYKSENKKRTFNNIKGKFKGNNLHKLFSTIEDIERGFIPYSIDNIFTHLFRIVTYPYNNYAFIANTLTFMEDPFALDFFICKYSNNLTFIFELVKTKNSKLIIFGLCLLYKYFEKIEISFYKYIIEIFHKAINSKDNALIHNLQTEKRKLKNQIRDNLKDLLNNLKKKLNNTEQYFEIISYFLKEYFRFKQYNFQGLKYHLHSIEIFHDVIIELISKLVSKPGFYSRLKEIYELSEMTIHFYGYLSGNLISERKNHFIIKENFEFYYNDFRKRILSEEHHTHFGFQYAYQLNYLSGFLSSIISYNRIQQDKNYYFNEIMEQLKQITLKFEDPFVKQHLLDYSKFENMKYFTIVIFRLILEYQNQRVKLNDVDIKQLLTVLDVILEEWEFTEIKQSDSDILWEILSKLSKKNEMIKKYYFSKINSLRRFIPLCYVNMNIPTRIYKKIKTNLDFDLEMLDNQHLLDIYWALYLKEGLEDLLIIVFNKLSDDTRNELILIHQIRINRKIKDVHEIISLLKNKIHYYNTKYNLNNYLIYWQKYFKKLKNIDSSNLLSDLLMILN